ncbi:MAG: HTTM domain-containing protein [Deltaproteobacteria bacterium]|nr:HTTM domain-containing protein [Deltaproteobacteria bacterium]
MFTLDVRSLALMRIAVAATVLADLGYRAVHLTEHYTDDGVLPRETARGLSWIADASLLAVSGSPLWAGLVFAVAAALAVATLVGFRTRIATPLLWLAMLSIQHRDPLLWDHRDVLFSASLCCGALLPWGDAFSVDARGRGAARTYTGAPAALYVVQLACIYLFAALLKDGPEWRSDFTAVERAISVEYWARPAAHALLDHPSLAAALTAGVLVFEAALAPLLLSPWRTALVRWIAVAGLCALQVGFFVFLWLDTFPMIAAAMTLGLVPSSAWSRPAVAVVDRSRRRSGLACALIVYVVALNLASLHAEPGGVARAPAELLGLRQNWSMFAPSPSRLDGWFLVLARDRDGATSDLLTGRGDDLRARPASFREGIRTTRELVYMRRLLSAAPAARESFAAARCRTGDASIAVYFVPVVDGAIGPRELLVERACAQR